MSHAGFQVFSVKMFHAGVMPVEVAEGLSLLFFWASFLLRKWPTAVGSGLSVFAQCRCCFGSLFSSLRHFLVLVGA